ncbi:immunoglobulin-like domain-containing protein, partial [Listeria booriae]|uniref:immunoglobulin-like domain-containing protein n=1 Tax=Listeria booriae TaxID=1552123 RepID=UPI0021AE2ABB
IDKAQEAINKVTDPAKKADLQKNLDEAQKQLNDRDNAAAEKARQEAAEASVKDLFNNGDVEGTIKDTTDQAAIDKAQEAINKVTDSAKKAELQKELDKAQQQLNDRNSAAEAINGKGATYTLGDLYITGTYTGPATGMSIDVNGKRYYGGTAIDGTLKFYGLDKIFKVDDEVIINLYGADKQIKQSFPLQIVEPLQVNVVDYKVGDNYINATYNNSNVAKVGVVVDGKKYWGGDVANGKVKFYALDKISSADAVATMNFYDAENNLLATKKIKIAATYAGEVTTATLKLTDTNIRGTVTGDIKQVAISINGKMYYGGAVLADGTYRFYSLDKKITTTDEVIVYGYGPDNKKLSEKVVTISE